MNVPPHDPLLNIHGLSVEFPVRGGAVTAVSDVSLSIERGEIFGLIGESGSGKSVLGMAIMRLLPESTRISGEIRLGRTDVLSLTADLIRKLRGGEIGLVPQNPGSALNPVLRVEAQIGEAVRLHRGLDSRGSRRVVHYLLGRMGLVDPARTAKQYPFELSGGMRQRVLAAIGIAGQPSLLIADEPTKGLDAIVRSQVIETLYAATQEAQASMLVITHDLRVAEQLCDRVGVMYAGRLIEVQETRRLFSAPLHPYTRALLKASPANGMRPLPGSAPSPFDRLQGCAFAPRCDEAEAACRLDQAICAVSDGAQVRCWRHAG